MTIDAQRAAETAPDNVSSPLLPSVNNSESRVSGRNSWGLNGKSSLPFPSAQARLFSVVPRHGRAPDIP